jgi:hypothetical protein
MASMVNELSGDKKLPVYQPITWGKDQKNKDQNKNDKNKGNDKWGNGNIHEVSYDNLGNYQMSNRPLAFGSYATVGNEADISTFAPGPKWDTKMKGITAPVWNNTLYEASNTPMSNIMDDGWEFTGSLLDD